MAGDREDVSNVCLFVAGNKLNSPFFPPCAHLCLRTRRYYCINGTKLGCPAGTFQSNIRKSLSSDCGTCTAGGYCGAASAVPTNCGNDSVYCPSGSSAPLPVGPGYYSTGVAGARSARVQCSAGQYCPGDGLAYDCPAGYVAYPPHHPVPPTLQ